MANEDKRPIVIKRIKKVAGGHHGGAWKIAYADFVTAMMAFFLLMWLLGSTAKGDLQGISEYFKTPLKVALMGGTGSGDSSSIIKGGGQDLTRATGQVKSGELLPEKKVINLKATQEEFERLERKKELEKLKDLKANIEKAIDTDVKLKKYKNQILLDLTTEGLRVQIVDEKNRPMFQSGSSELEPYTKDILHEIGQMLNTMPNKISLSGHTDAQPYVTADRHYSNWELSADRANASRRELINGGLAEDKIVRVVGLSSAVLFDKAQPLNPINRRISIIVMNKRAEEAASQDGGSVNINTETGDPLDAASGVAMTASAPVAASATPGASEPVATSPVPAAAN
ncbi:flagellar motor protein MotB [Sideroxydans lithotrophicus]|uniref:OmpA/MotB domain protein n=1 Tax=Sideroxydans lithotrophicus (strain ES-1) TaxID=580332 RepID=D5CMU7_SIDLE|nr:flagellar motor protein MotB [Sideroxydans lithotrophicus]ADE10783.1 OmpA/MotB domain protein [Sideroxydans lithotrophicus ES-1]